jgi:peptidyl-tRNA hydrolase, PTH1 family
MRFVVGLGNPGERYCRTRHNAGYRVVDALATLAGCPPLVEEDGSLVAEATLAGQAALLAKPLSFMNASGVAVARLLGRRAGAPADLVVVVDDAALELGRIRVRERGSHGGHNGLRSLIDVLGTEEFSRVRVGIGRGELPVDLAGFVLSDFPPEEVLVVQEALGRAAEAVICLLGDGPAEAMNRFNGRSV